MGSTSEGGHGREGLVVRYTAQCSSTEPLGLQIHEVPTRSLVLMLEDGRIF